MHHWVLGASVCGAGAVILGLSSSMLPVPGGDDFYFMPVVVNYSAGNGLYTFGWRETDPTGAGRMVWHGYLQPMLYGSLLWSSTYRALVLLHGFVAIVTLALTSVIFSQVLRSSRSRSTVIPVLAAALMIVGLVPCLLTGRPEPLACLILLATTILLSRAPILPQPIVIGVSLTLLGITTPVGALLAALLTGCFYSWNNAFAAAAIKYAATMAIAACGVALSSQFIYPFGLVEWMHGLHYATRMLNYLEASRTQYWLFSPSAFMFGPLFVTALGCGVVLTSRFIANVKCLTGLIGFGIAFLLASWRFSVWVSARHYNLFPSRRSLVCLFWRFWLIKSGTP